ncbi:glycerophosphodiester phosphodiesterase [Deinococcus deserti]|uniref:Putative glycerophosphodiester phosphodiesterase (Glycerophosphoryl diester phosphodiesterase) n=1 Tax=Deinococcus deserti (strain DSM 17065 / CIP 109153 / LMG 22923 / VCD115) TaxID=546414 RepID=C1D385_DEIDV|nr:glycerophosphodiester phosphodiesterase [Deinococcus deserti]ACO47874.1 putative glycerophosphodiester phosphodiesterase (Glycerophosphoryl diester phosphodiesterase) [Deinococcus deserti VCD115]
MVSSALRRPLLLGHRGSPREHLENSLSGFQAALDAGLDGIELDVRRLRDGTLVVHHDAVLPDGRALTTLERHQLPPQVPTLAQALAWAGTTGAYVNVELKFEAARPDDRVGRTLDLIRAFGLTGQVIVSSFNPWLLLAARLDAPEVPRALLIHRSYRLGPLDLVPLVMRWTDCQALHPLHTLVTRSLMAQARTHGWRVNAWTVNSLQEVQRLCGLEVDGLIGDLPPVLLSARPAPGDKARSADRS